MFCALTSLVFSGLLFIILSDETKKILHIENSDPYRPLKLEYIENINSDPYRPLTLKDNND